jgi:hypothetical protein
VGWTPVMVMRPDPPVAFQPAGTETEALPSGALKRVGDPCDGVGAGAGVPWGAGAGRGAGVP